MSRPLGYNVHYADFLRLAKKWKKFCRFEVWPFGKRHHSVLLSSSFLYGGFKCLSRGSVLWKRWQHVELFTQQPHFYKNMVKIICLPGLTYDILKYKPLYIILNYVHQFLKIRVVFHTLYLWKEVGDPLFIFAFLTQVTHYLTTVKPLKNLSTRKFSRERS